MLFIVKVVGFLIITGVVGFAWKLWVSASRLEQEIKEELSRSGEE
jgi:hypothetical protein